MEYVLAGSASTLHIDFIVDGELVVPVTPTITLSGNDGVAISGFNGLAITLGDPSDTFANVAITTAANTKTLVFEFRTALINFQYNSKNYSTRIKYGLATRLDIPVMEDEVRAIIGLTEEEWPNNQIDIQAAYLTVDDAISASASNIIDGGTALLRDLIEAIKLRAIIDVLPAVELMANQSIQVDNTVASRFSKIDFAVLRKNIEDRYSSALLGIEASVGTVPDIAILGEGDDPVTGEA